MSRSPRTRRIRRILRAAVALTGVAVFSLAGCRGDDDQRPPAPRDRNGHGDRSLGDFDKDGYDDFATTVVAEDPKLRSEPEGHRLVVVPGSRRGLDTARHRVFAGLEGPLLRADLDGDGYTDLAARRDPNPGGAPGPGGAREAVILHGGRDGLGDPVPVRAEGDFHLAAVADVDGDDHPDLIDGGVGRVSHDPGVRPRPGRIAYGPFGRDGAPAREVRQEWNTVGGALTAGDFDGDDYDDLLFTTTQTPVPDQDEPEFVPVDTYFRGGPGGPEPARYPPDPDNQVADGPTVPAAGDVDGDGRTDLLVHGDRRVDYDRHPTAGRLTVVYGAEGGLGTGRKTVTLDQETPGVPGDSEHGDRFGSDAGTGDVTGDGHPDLVVNSPGEDRRSGRVTLVPGTPEGPDPSRAVVVDLDTPGVPGERYPSGRDNFAATFPLLDVDGDRHADVVARAVGYYVRSTPGLWLIPGGTSGFRTDAVRSVKPGPLGLDPRHWT
ncbi:FG-GAP repeat protein [Streptomyces fragilis]|uniref:FG-GAP repeat protein n=1 Tax=Streptomyces fragilis TaxID=67301 RepID=A0ABV2YFA0_9ACTN|nr:FG-GAP repeat protein [Streptomyces fragilis]